MIVSEQEIPFENKYVPVGESEGSTAKIALAMSGTPSGLHDFRLQNKKDLIETAASVSLVVLDVANVYVLKFAIRCLTQPRLYGGHYIATSNKQH